MESRTQFRSTDVERSNTLYCIQKDSCGSSCAATTDAPCRWPTEMAAERILAAWMAGRFAGRATVRPRSDRPDSSWAAITVPARQLARAGSGHRALSARNQSGGIRPLDVVARARERLAARQSRLVLPEGTDPRILEAAARLGRDHGVHCILLGPDADLRQALSAARLPADAIEIVDPEAGAPDPVLVDAYIARRPGTRRSLAERLSRKPLVCAGLLVATGRADALVAGASCPTARVIEAALLTIGLADGVGTPSSCFVMQVPPGAESAAARTLLFADCAINVDPSPQELADIALASAQSLRELTGDEPRVAFLSFSTRGSAKHARVERGVVEERLDQARLVAIAHVQ